MAPQTEAETDTALMHSQSRALPCCPAFCEVKVRLVCKDRGKPTPTEIAKFNRQYKGLAVTYSDDFHDRFLVIDNIELHGLGSSINCLGRRVTSFSTRDAKEIAKLLAMVP